MLIEHEAKLYYKNPQVNERLEQTQKEIQNTEKSKVRHSLKMLHNELVQRQSLIRSENAADSVKDSMWPEDEHVTSPFEPLNERNSFSHDLPVPPIETRKTLSKPLPPAPKYVAVNFKNLTRVTSMVLTLTVVIVVLDK